MFRTEGICGQLEMSVDDKNRMILPEHTGAEPGEKLVIVRNKESKCYDIYAEKHYQKKLQLQIDYLENKLKTAIDIKMREKLQLLLNDIYSCILAEVTCDKQRRIVITSILEENEKVTKVKTIGAFDHLMLRKK
ncbi:MAG: hypothetical protein IJY25_03515 [Bacilli bacterium]|nr:hypothetical protein [Bacilli bacterium]